VRAACRATPPMRMAPSRSNFPYPAPITCIEARREGCHLREIEECRATKGHLSASFWTSRNGTTALSARISLWHRRVSDAGRSNRLRIRASLALRCMLARKPKWRSVDETVRVWDAHTWAEVHIQHHPGAIIRAVWSPDSSRILTTSSDNTAHVLKAWPLLTADTVLHSSVTAFRVLNGDERSSLFLDSGSPSSTAPELMTAATGEEPEILCDRLASTPFDPEKTSVSIAFLDIDFTKAVRACEAAAKAHPHDLKFQYERARVHALWYLVPADYIAFHAFQRTDMAATESVGGPTGRGSVSPSIARYRGDMILGTALSVRAIAERGYAAAIADLGQAYEFGDGVKRDPAEALRLYKQASEKGFLPAFAAVALIYSNGLAGIVDHQEAMRWLERGAAAGDPFSHIRLAELSEEGNRIPKDVEQALLHWIIAVRLFEKLGEGDSESAIVARVRRGSIARGLSPSVVVRIARQAAN